MENKTQQQHEAQSQSDFDGIENEDDKRKVKFIRNRESGSYESYLFHNISKFGIVQSESNHVKNQMCFWIFGEPKQCEGLRAIFL
jgi:hypothetical protein